MPLMFCFGEDVSRQVCDDNETKVAHVVLGKYVPPVDSMDSLESPAPVTPTPQTPTSANKSLASTDDSREPAPSDGAGDGTVENPEPIYVCDYDVNPTVLYQAIEEKQWLHVMAVFGKVDLPNSIKEERSAKIQAATWVDRKEANGKPRWRLLPLHAAIIFEAPIEVVKVILDSYPKGVRSKDDRSMLPIHLAFKHGRNEGVVQLLTDAYPESVHIKDFKGRTPLECAAVSDIPNRGLVTYTTTAVAIEKKATEQKLEETKIEHKELVKELSKEKAGLQESSKKLKRELEESRKKVEKLKRKLEEKVKIQYELSDKLDSLTKDIEKTKDQKQKVGEEHAQKVTKLKNEADEIQKEAQKEVSATTTPAAAAPAASGTPASVPVASGSKKFFGLVGSSKNAAATKPAAATKSVVATKSVAATKPAAVTKAEGGKPAAETKREVASQPAAAASKKEVATKSLPVTKPQAGTTATETKKGIETAAAAPATPKKGSSSKKFFGRRNGTSSPKNTPKTEEAAKTSANGSGSKSKLPTKPKSASTMASV